MTLSLGSSLEKKVKKLFWALTSSRLPPEGAGVSPGRTASVLVLRPDRLGDFILSVPALQALQKSMGPSLRYTLVAGVRNAGLARFFFPRAEILTFHRDVFRRPALFLRLWLGKYDAVVDLHSYPFSTSTAFMTLLAGGRRRVGFWAAGDFAEYREISRKIFNAGMEAPPENLHEAEKGFKLVRALAPAPKGRPLLRIPPSPPGVRERVRSFFRRTGAGPGHRLIGIHPTLRKKDNRWSREKYLELTRELLKFPEVKIFVVHGAGEGPLLERFKEDLTGFSNVFILPESDVLFILDAAKRFDLFVCNDSGLMHLASPVTRVVAVFGPSEPGRWGPLSAGKGAPRILRKSDGLCDSVSTLEVVREIQKILKSKRRPV